MSQNPPASGGWIDPYGTAQPGVPPPGYWQASDGRWYPPESRSAEPYVPPSEDRTVASVPMADPYGGPVPGGPGFAPPSNPGPGFGPPPGSGPGPGFGPPPGPSAGPGFGPGFGGPPQGPAGGPGFGPPPGPGGFAPAPSPYAPSQFGGPGPAPGAPKAKSRTGLWIVLGVVLFAFVGCGAFGVYLVNKADETLDETLEDLSVTTITAGDTTSDSEPDDDFDSIFGGTEDGLADIVSCTRLDEDRLRVEMVNNSDQQSDYGLTIILEDTPGQRLADTIGFVEDLRPGERTLEEVFVFDAEGANCTVTAADRYPVEVDTAALADVSACRVKEEDSLGSLVAEVSVANAGQVNYDYSVTVAVLNADGVRQGSGYALIETVRPGETAPGDVFTSITDGDGFTCEAVSVDRSES